MNGLNSNNRKVILIGRPNAGKSTLFNRLVGKKLAIEAKEAGTTRDWQFEELRKKDSVFDLIDSAGLSIAKNSLDKSMQDGLKSIINQSDLILWVVDGRQGLSAEDLNWQKFVRAQNKPTWLVVNKVDNLNLLKNQSEFERLAFPEIIFLSSLHNKNVVELEKKLWQWARMSPQSQEEAFSQGEISFAIIGRSNVGKSSLANALINASRSVVSDVPSTTHDPVKAKLLGSEIDWQNAASVQVKIIDTAGLKRKSRQKTEVEFLSAKKTQESIESSDVMLLVLNASEEITQQDLKIAGLGIEQGKSIIIVVNKWDLVGNLSRSDYIKKLQKKAKFLHFAPVIFTSALTKMNISDLRDLLQEVWLIRNKRLSEIDLKDFLNNEYYPVLKVIKKISQTEINPPLFVIENSRPLQTHELRQLKNALTEHFSFFATPILIRFA